MSEPLREEWRAIPGTDGLYSVSSAGRVRSEPMPGRTGKPRGRILSPRADRKGYLCFRVCLTSGIQWHTRVHQAVAAAFIGPRPEGLQVNHKDGIKANNTPENLEYVTCKENIRHCWATGLHGTEHCTGEANGRAKLTSEDVQSIRAIYPAKSLEELAVMFGVGRSSVHNIVRRKTWAHVA